MADLKNSALLEEILTLAETLRKQSACSGMTRDHILVAAITVVDRAGPGRKEEDGELAAAAELLSGLSRERSDLDRVLNAWRDRDVPRTEVMLLATEKGKALRAARELNSPSLTAGLYLAEVLKDHVPGLDILRGAEPKAGKETPRPLRTPRQEGEKPADQPKAGPEEAAAPEKEAEPLHMSGIVDKVRTLQEGLGQSVMGQQFAVSTFASGYFQAELRAEIETDRTRPRATFLFAGPPGVGKTFLSETAAKLLGLPFRRFDMSEYAGPNSTDELSGSDANYKGSAEGQLTGFVSRNPKCLLLFDEIEKASLQVIHLFLQVLDAGRLRDNRTDEEVEFKDAILIFTTNAGRSLYEGEHDGSLSALSRDVILDALARDVDPRTREPYFPAAICSRFASGNVVMFDRLDAQALLKIVEGELTRQAADLEKRMGIRVNLDPNVPAALLLAEGAAADARTVKSRASAFFSGELYELFRLLGAKGDAVRTVSMSVNLHGEREDICRLFTPGERIQALAYGDAPLTLRSGDPLIPILHNVHTPLAAREIIRRENIQLLLCDLFSGGGDSAWLNMEDRASPARDFLLAVREKHPGLPVVLLESEGRRFSEEEKISYLRRGVRGFLSLEPEGLEERMRQFSIAVFQQNCLTELARGNRVIRYETAQSVSPDGASADIVIFDMRPEKAVKSEDQDNILSMLSVPDVKFSDVVGAEDVKKEMEFFLAYMREPKKYLRQGVSAPKGILLYGPPGTGKTMLAKAFAAESGATFIAAEGNQFFKGIVGQGAAMVHRLFSAARRYAPAVIFIDEIDAIARARTGRDTDMAQDSEQILTALFAEMDGFSTTADKPVFVLGATNYSVEQGSGMSLDPAMLRRFDRRILVDLPKLEHRRSFLDREIRLRSIFQVTPDCVAGLADRSTGMSLAQLTSILDLAIRLAMQKGEEKVTDRGLEEAFETYNSGESRKWNAETTLRTARHEAGHALLSWLAGEKPSFVTIVSRGSYGGYMRYADQEERMGYTRRELLARIRTALGGRAAELVCYGREEGVSTGASGDLRSATDMAKQMLCRYGMDEGFGLAAADPAAPGVAEAVLAGANALLKEQMEEAVRLIRENRDKLDALTDGLLKSNSLRAREIEAILA